MLKYEKAAVKAGYEFIIGIDEAGRGPLAGPVVAAAVLLKKNSFRSVIRDSKMLTEKQRENAFSEIQQKAYVGVGIISENVIDEINILRATYLAMRNAVEELIYRLPVDVNGSAAFSDKVCLLVDGNSFHAEVPYHYRTLIDGEGSSLSIASASIIAKVTRDRILCTYDKIYPQYGFKDHKGYATLRHRTAIKRFGLSLIHRKSFQVKFT